MKKVKTNIPVTELTKLQLARFNTWLDSPRTFINLTLKDGRVFRARKE